MSKQEKLRDISSQIRRDILRMVFSAKSGHPGGSMSSADIMTALFFDVMKHDPGTWSRDAKNQDAFILSAGHLAPVYYSVLARCGYFPVSELGTLRKFGSHLQGHPCVSLRGVYQAAGSLGQGLACAAGMALSKKMNGASENVYCLLGDGELEEGEIWESVMWAANHNLNNLIACVDWNQRQIDGDVNVVGGLGDLCDKWSAFGWKVIEADGHDYDSILSAFDMAKCSEGKPVVILFHTVMAKGVDFMEGDAVWHGTVPDAEKLALALSQLKETIGDY